MFVRSKQIRILLVLMITGFLGVKLYTYFFDTSQPYLAMQGIEIDGHYAGDVPSTMISTKAGEISIWLDEQPLVTQFKLPGNAQGHQFTIPTKTISNGRHTLRAQLVDNTYVKNKAELTREFYVDNVPLQAAFVKPDADYKVFQGRTLHVQFQVNKDIKEAKVSTLSHTFDCFPESKNSSVYEAFIPVACEENANEYLFTIDITDKVGNALKLENKFQVVMYPFKKQALQISEEKIKEEEALAPDMKRFEQLIEELSQSSPKEKMWKGAFCTPIEVQRVTCDFGAIRTTQHKGRYAHKALDLLNAPRSVVWATQDGVVVMKERFSGSGNTVVIDHGMGLLSMFFHLDDFAKIEVGDKVAQGNPIGRIGKTGYATGYHLHWEMRINNIAIDPMQWTKPIF